MEENDVAVRVAVRVRPQIPREIISMCGICTQVTPDEPQVVLGSDKAFTYDFVFDMNIGQEDIYDTCVAGLVNGALDGYNATVLAYGQTGSGKTYTMGTGFEINLPEDQLGIIPRAISHLFQGIENRIVKTREDSGMSPEFKITAQFLELYNEEIIDLFNPIKGAYIKGKGCKINEDPNGDIHIKGVTTKPVRSIEDAIQYLKLGALSRTTASTQMNSQSSRSHAIFTLHIIQQRLCAPKTDLEPDTESLEPSEFETLSAKFHFVDLAGSERLKRTGATGERAKEGISINCGLLALGNVISALGDKAKKALHVPYRDSKLTRLLQDSLGGNSQTVMIACISPSDRDFMETLNTLKYANRARNIKNHITINQDKSSRTINVLRQQIAQLQLELVEYKQGKRVIEEDGTETINDMFYENNMLQSELNNLKTRVKAMQETIDSLIVKNTQLLAEKETGVWFNSDSKPNLEVTDMIQAYLQEIEDLRAKLLESNYICEQLRKVSHKGQDSLSNSLMINSTASNDFTLDDTSSVIVEARKTIQREKEKLERNKKTDDTEEFNYDSSDKDTDSDLDSDSEGREVDAGLQAEIVNLTTDIDMKQRLIDELELSQQRLQTMRQHYEEKLFLLQTRIRDTQEERDKILQTFTGQSSEPKEKVQRVRQDYERKIQEMQKELKRLHQAKKEHARLLRNQTQHEYQLRSLKNEVTEMKRTKVKLMSKMKEESQRHKDAESKRIREIAQLKKESRRNANTIRSMEAECRAKEQVLRRKQEEVSALRREKQRRNNLKGSTRLDQRTVKAAKQKWVNVEKMINKSSMVKQGLVEQELKMEQLLEKRVTLGKDLEKYQTKRTTLLANKQSTEEVDNLIDDLRANINYIQDIISETQHNFMEIDESQETNDAVDVAQSVFDISEARYLIQKLFNMTINQSYAVAQRDAKLKENDTTVHEMKQEIYLRGQLLDHMLHADQDGIAKNMISSFSNNANESDPEPSSNNTSRSSSPVDNDGLQVPGQKPKIRRRTALPQELLFGNTKQEDCDDQLLLTPNKDNSQMSKIPSAPSSLKELVIVNTNIATEPSNNKILDKKPSVLPSPKASHRILLQQSTKHGSIEQGLNWDISSPPSSPLAYRRMLSRDDNVFYRLTSSSVQVEDQTTVGHISPYNGKNYVKSGLQCVMVAEGHSNGVLSVCATDDLLFTGAADRTVKVWDLQKGIEKTTLTGHPHNVVAVRYFAPSQLLLSASSAFVKIWDLRASDTHCIKVLCSSGVAQPGTSLSFLSSNRSAQIPVGESQINDVLFNTAGTMICTASSGKVKLWDVRKLAPIAKLSGGHQAAIMCLACEPASASTDVIITGSKDHYIKVFNIGQSEMGNITPSMNLEPPHYDGVQSLAVDQNILFSGSRDMCIKKWNLGKAKLVQSISNAHRGWICGLALLKEQRLLISGCRMGYLKIWETGSCNQLAEIKAHTTSINAITVNAKYVFTASNCGEVKIWKYGNL